MRFCCLSPFNFNCCALLLLFVFLFLFFSSSLFLLCFCVCEEEGMDDDVNCRDGPGRTHLHRLCSLPLLKERDLADLTRLLHSGADPNLDDSFERAPLALLCMHTGNLEAARALLSAGALPSAQDAWGRYLECMRRRSSEVFIYLFIYLYFLEDHYSSIP